MEEWCGVCKTESGCVASRETNPSTKIRWYCYIFNGGVGPLSLYHGETRSALIFYFPSAWSLHWLSVQTTVSGNMENCCWSHGLYPDTMIGCCWQVGHSPSHGQLSCSPHLLQGEKRELCFFFLATCDRVKNKLLVGNNKGMYECTYTLFTSLQWQQGR